MEVFVEENLDEPKRHYLLGSDAINTFPTKPIPYRDKCIDTRAKALRYIYRPWHIQIRPNMS